MAALVDFSKLAILYKLAHGDVGVFSNCSHPHCSRPPPMAPKTRLQTRAQAAKSGRIKSHSQVPPPSRLVTPRRKGQAKAQLARGTTPPAHGTSIFPKLEPDTESPTTYTTSKWEEYLVEDFERHRIFVDIDVLMERVLRIPKNWRDLWGDAIRQVKVNPPFAAALLEYNKKCETEPNETEYYASLVNLINAIFDYAKTSSDEVKPRTPLHCLRNDPNKIFGGVMNPLVPDIVTVLDGGAGETGNQRESTLTWSRPLQVVEVKPQGDTLVDGTFMTRLKINGKPSCSRNSAGELTENRTGPEGQPCKTLCREKATDAPRLCGSRNDTRENRTRWNDSCFSPRAQATCWWVP